MPLDRAGAEEDLSADLGVGQPVAGAKGDLQLLRREVPLGARLAPAYGRPRGQQLAAGTSCEDRIREAAEHGYDSFRAVGGRDLIVRNGVDIREWFAAESQLNEIDPAFPHFFSCRYDVDLLDGSTIMHVLRTHPRVYVNGILITNPHYQAGQLPG
jgi:MEDS: MEthanogen/methylotroph, DcmR Sensory domain